MEKNQLCTVTCDTLGSQGEGVVRGDGVTIFVPYLLPGERAVVKVLKQKGSVAYARIEEILTPAEERVRPQCAVFARCGGCQLQHIKYRTQLKFKTGLVRETLRKIGGVETEVSFCERSEKEYGYRNKLQLPIGRRGEENVIGFFAARTHRIVPTHTCPIHPEWSEKLIAAVLRFMEKCGLDGYDEESGTGQLRHIVVRELRGKYIVTLVTTVREIKGIDYLLFLLDEIFPAYSFYLNFNDARTNVVFGKEFLLLKGKGSYECTDGGIVYEAGPQTFVQVNENVRGKLYDRALAFADADDVVIDCNAGGGLLTAKFAKKCRAAYGIEIVPEAHACAEAVRERNGLQEKMTNLCGKVEDLLPALLAEAKGGVVVLDPPRAGVSRDILKGLMDADVKRIVMISCDPATLARDVGLLTGTLVETEQGELVKAASLGLTPSGSYAISCVEPFDMFPQTKHVETLVCLERK